MRQHGRRGVAPLNDNPNWPEGYFAIPRDAGAPEKTIPFYAAWVRRFFARFPGRSRRSLGRADIEAFLREMTRRSDIANGQISQARDALKLYYGQFRGIPLTPRQATDDRTEPSYKPPSAVPTLFDPKLNTQSLSARCVDIPEPVNAKS
jgi:hypothetical protein